MNFLAQNGVYLDWFTGPISVDTGSKTHTISVNTDGDIEVHQLVHSTGVVTTTELEGSFNANDHAPCAIAELGSGKLIAFWTIAGSGSGITYKISTNVDDSTAWGSAQTLGAGTIHSYARVIRLTGEGSGSGRLYVFTRTPTSTKRVQYYYSDDDGSTWSSLYDFLRASDAAELPYAVFGHNGVDRIDVAVSVVQNTGSRYHYHVYHCYLQDEEAFASDGTSLGTRGNGDFPLTTETDLTEVYNSTDMGNDEAWVWECLTNGSEPSILFATFPDKDTDHDYYIATWDDTGEDWDDLVKVCDGGGLIVSPSVTENHYSGGICFDGDDPDAVFASIGDFSDGSRIVRLTRSGDTWSEDYTVCGTHGRSIQNFRPVVPFSEDGTVARRCRLIWIHSSTYNDQDDYDCDIRYMADAVGMAAAGWSHVIEMDIASSQVTGDPGVNGGMMALITHANFTSTNSTTFWANVKNGGGDIRASVGKTNTGGDEYDAIQVLPVDVFYCNTSTEKLKMRVLLPEAATANTIQIWFGNSGASARTTLTGHGSDGFPGSHAVYSPRYVAYVPDFTIASGNLTDRSSNGHTFTVDGSPDYQQTDYWGGPGAMYFTGSDNDRAWIDEEVGKCPLGWVTPDLAASPTEDSEMWWFFQGNRSVAGRYIDSRILDTSAPHDLQSGATGDTAGGGDPIDNEAFSGFAQVHAVLEMNASQGRSVQVNDRTPVTGASTNIGALNTTVINGLRTPNDIYRGKGTYHDMIVFTGRYLQSDALDTYWANHDDPAAFWDEGTVVAMTASATFQAAWARPTVTISA